MFLNRISIASRLGMMFAVQVILLLVIGAAGIVFLNKSSDTTSELATKVERVADSKRLLALLEGRLSGTLHKVNIGAITWEDGAKALEGLEADFETQYERLFGGVDTAALKVDAGAQGEVSAEEAKSFFEDAMAEVSLLMEQQDRGFLDEFLLNDAEFLITPMVNLLANEVESAQQASEAALVVSKKNAELSLLFSGVILVFGVLLAVGLGFAATASIIKPVERISQVVAGVSEGDFQVRTGLLEPDEIGQLGRAFDALLDERVAALAETEREAENLNDSVISLLRAVSTLSDRDLTVQVPVTEDATGPVADAINQMANETAEVLKQVRDIAVEVEQASGQVNSQATTVNEVGARQQLAIEKTAEQLASVTERLTAIAETARKANKVAELAIKTTKVAAGTVHSTQQGMGRIRETIQETGKRIKRLGERTQEISGIVDVINGIAERTTVLALNASMQAAAAGDAGRGFAVVADEVQRLAESSRRATEQIATLVKNIVAETNDTMAVMDSSIGQVVDGAQQAERAVQQMAKTVQTTGFLVSAVEDIANGTEQQARMATVLRERADTMRKQTEQTGQQLIAQLGQTKKLVDYANRLVGAVSVFKLPG